MSTDLGRSWKETPHTPAKPLFGETGINGYPVKIGSPHFVDFGKDMQHSPDGKAYLVAHGADSSDPKWRFWNDSWITGDQVYLIRVEPSPETINDASKYEFYAGRDAQGKPVWTADFSKIKPLLAWNNDMGCVTVTYNAPLKKFLMCVTDGGNTCARMNTYILESDALTGPWRLVTVPEGLRRAGLFRQCPVEIHQRGRPDDVAALLGQLRRRLERREAGHQSAGRTLRPGAPEDRAAPDRVYGRGEENAPRPRERVRSPAVRRAARGRLRTARASRS